MAEMEKTFALHVPSSTENLAMIRDFVSKLGEMAGMDEREVMKLGLAVDEACANVIEHAYGMDHSKEVKIRALLDADKIEIVIVDNGQSFNPGGVRQLNLEELVAQRKNGGLGLRLIKSIMDDVHYQIVPGEKNELRMVKRLKR
ncbi:MAG: ATP-binding protein [Bryobacteraceae bacterium]|nr:ATP-binding protein [Bryobacteraceae bacterium]